MECSILSFFFLNGLIVVHTASKTHPIDSIAQLATSSNNRNNLAAIHAATSARGKWSKFHSDKYSHCGEDISHSLSLPVPSHNNVSRTPIVCSQNKMPMANQQHSALVMDQTPMTPEQRQEWLKIQNWTWMLENALEIEFIIIVVVLICVFLRLVLMYFFSSKTRRWL